MAKVKSIRKPLKSAPSRRSKKNSPNLKNFLPLIGIIVLLILIPLFMLFANNKLSFKSKASEGSLTDQCQTLATEKINLQKEIDTKTSESQKCIDTYQGFFRMMKYNGEPNGYTCDKKTSWSSIEAKEICTEDKINEWNELKDVTYKDISIGYQTAVDKYQDLVTRCDNRTLLCDREDRAEFRAKLDICKYNKTDVDKLISEIDKHINCGWGVECCSSCVSKQKELETAKANLETKKKDFDNLKCTLILNPPKCGNPCNAELRCGEEDSLTCVRDIAGNKYATRCAIKNEASIDKCQKTGKPEDCCNAPTATPYPGCGKTCSGEVGEGKCKGSLVCVTYDNESEHKCAPRDQSIIRDCERTKGKNCCNVPTAMPTAPPVPPASTSTPIPSAPGCGKPCDSNKMCSGDNVLTCVTFTNGTAPVCATRNQAIIDQCIASGGTNCCNLSGQPVPPQTATSTPKPQGYDCRNGGTCPGGSFCNQVNGKCTYSSNVDGSLRDACTGSTQRACGSDGVQNCRRVWSNDRCMEYTNCGQCME